MKSVLLLVKCTVLVLLVQVSVVQAEVIQKFNAKYFVADSGLVTVEETITYDFEGTERHGIFRTIENKHPQPASSWYKKRFIDLDIESVTRNGVNEPFSLSQASNASEIKIGNADVTLSGIQTYVLRYVLTGAVSHGKSGAEFYYNVTGNQWEVPISLAVVTVSSDHFGSKYQCYQGVVSATTACTNSFRNGNEIMFTANSIQPSEGLTIATELDADSIAVHINEEISINWILYMLAVVWLFGLSIWAYRFRTAFKSNKPVIAQYEPYEGVLPMYTGVLFDGKLDPRDITAGIVYLAEQGFIKIRKTEEKVLWIFNTTDYEITLLQSMKDLPFSINQIVLELFFGNYAAVGSKMRLSYLPSKKRTENVALIQILKNSLNRHLVANGFIVSNLGGNMWRELWVILPGLLVVVFMLVSEQKLSFVGLLLMILPLVILVFAFSNRRTQKGYDAQNHLKGFKLFLSVTEKERYKFFNAPEKSPELFMKYLPYAIALGVDEQWQTVFKDITIPNPEWYEGESMGEFSAVAFSATDLTSGLGAFSNALASSGVSGSSGGGSSGGGGGGGGGGSW